MQAKSRVAKRESGDPSVSLDLIVRALLTSGVTRQELAQVIMGSDGDEAHKQLFNTL